MPNPSPLDMPMNKGRVVLRFPYSSFMECMIISTNIIVLISSTINIIWTTIALGFMTLFFVFYISILFISTSICLFLWNWRKVTLEYEKTGETSLLENQKVRPPMLMAGISLLFWGCYLSASGYIFLSSSLNSWSSIFYYILSPIFSAVILGPVQYFYLRFLKKLRRFVLSYNQSLP